VVAVGTGQALRIAQNGDADVLVVHHRPSEDRFVAEGFGIERRDVMYNDFVIVGPATDPADVRNATDLAISLGNLKSASQRFISRGDDSGTHKRELELWAMVNGAPKGDAYREIGAGMGAALNMAASIDAYTLSDRGTWLSFGNKRDLELVFTGDPMLRNPYGVILVNPAVHPHVNVDGARVFSDWLISDRGQTLIADFRVSGKQLFCPNSALNPKDDEEANVCPADGS
jgi:tungstate transport system substrate-binding protein